MKKKFVWAALLTGLLASGAVYPSHAQSPVCEEVWMPDLAPPPGEPTGVISESFPVPPQTSHNTMYPFDLSSRIEGDGSWTVMINQIVGHPSKAYRQWNRVTRVSIISFMSYVWPFYQNGTGGWLYQDITGVWRPALPNATLLGYTTLPHTSSPGVEPTWAYRTDFRTWTPTDNRALSLPLLPGTGWNVGIIAPYGVSQVGLQVKAHICGQRVQ